MLVISGKHGRLCNRLFTFSNIIAFAAEYGLTVCNPAFGDYAEWFPSVAGDPFCRFPSVTPRSMAGPRDMIFRANHLLMRLSKKTGIFPVVRLREPEKFSFADRVNEASVQSLKESRLAFLDGFYFLDDQNVKRHSQLIRTFLSPAKLIQENVQRCVDDARVGADVLVGVHIRQGDYKYHGGGCLYYSTEEYAFVMRQILKLFTGKTVKFLVCSDSVQDERHFKALNYQRGPGQFIEDLFSLASCDYLVGAPSTYSQWASFYGGVPRYVLPDRRNEGDRVYQREPRLEDFRVHTCGFGMYVEGVPSAANTGAGLGELHMASQSPR